MQHVYKKMYVDVLHQRDKFNAMEPKCRNSWTKQLKHTNENDAWHFGNADKREGLLKGT